MRDYAKVSPKFWIGETGKLLRGCPDAQVLALYLLSCPHANMLGLYYLPMTFIAHETGMTLQGASKALRRGIEAHFCGYDEEAEVVWVYEMAKFQIAPHLKAEDKRCVGVANEYENLKTNKYLGDFFDKYKGAFHLKERRENASPLEAPSKPLRSQEQEQEQDIKPSPKPDGELDGFSRFWKAWPPSSRKESRKACLKRWSDAGYEKDADKIIAHVLAKRGCEQWRDEKFIPAPLVYLNQARWDGAEIADDPFKGVICG